MTDTHRPATIQPVVTLGEHLADCPDLSSRPQSPPPDASSIEWAELAPSALADHIERTHHAYLRRQLPWLSELAERVEAVHGQRHPELTAARAAYEALRAELEAHLMREEEILFPLIREIDSAVLSGRQPVGTLANPIAVIRDDHDQVVELMTELGALTGSFTTPSDGCTSYRSLYVGLSALVADTNLHVHLEDNVLFPATADREHLLARRVDQ